MDQIFHRQQSEYLKTRCQQDQRLLDSIKARLPELERLLVPFQCMYEDGIYRFYHHSFKVYQLENYTSQAVEIFKIIAKATDKKICGWFEEIVTAGTGLEWQPEHNLNWTLHTRPIVEAFFHTKYFLEMMIRCGREMDEAPTILPSGWAAVLELYGQR